MNKPRLGKGLAATLYRGASLFLLIHVFGMVFHSLLHVFLARTLGPAGYGRYALAANWAALFLPLAYLGWNTAALRFVSSYNSQGEWSLLRGFLGACGKVVSAASVAVGSCLVVAVIVFFDDLDPDLAIALLIAGLVVPISALTLATSAILRGLKHVGRSQIPPALIQPLGFGAAFLALSVGGWFPLNAVTAMVGHLIGVVLALGVSLFLLVRVLPSAVVRNPAQSSRRQWWAVATTACISSLFQATQLRATTAILGFFADAADVGVFSSAFRIGLVTSLGLFAMNAWAAPLIAELHAAGDRAGLQRLIVLAARGVTAITLPPLILVVFFGEPVLGLFGQEFTAGHHALIILVAGYALSALTGPVGFLLTMTGRHSSAMAVEIAMAILLLGLSVALIPPFGIEGAAIANAATAVIRNLVLAVIVWRTMRIRAAVM